MHNHSDIRLVFCKKIIFNLLYLQTINNYIKTNKSRDYNIISYIQINANAHFFLILIKYCYKCFMYDFNLKNKAFIYFNNE